MSSEVFFNANTQPTDGTLDTTSITGNITSASRDYSGQGGGALSEFCGFDDAGNGSVPSGTTVKLQRQIISGDADSWVEVAELTNAASYVLQVIPNGTYRVVTTGYTADYKVKLGAV